MDHSSTVGYLAFALCLVVCLSASAEGTSGVENSKQAVENAKKSIKDVCQKAKTNIDNVNDALQKVESLKEKAAEATSQAAKELSQAEEKAKENRETSAIVENIKNIPNTITALHQNAITELKNTVSSLTQWLSEIQTLKDKCETELVVIESSQDDYKATSDNASYIKQNEGNLDSHSTHVSTIASVVDSTEENIKKSLTKAQLKNLHVSGIVAVTEIETIIGEAKNIIQETQSKKNQVRSVVTEMKKLCTNTVIESNEIIKALFRNANDALTDATGAVTISTKAKKDMTAPQQKAGEALNKVKAVTVVSDAQTEVNTMKECADNVKEIILQLQSQRQTAENSVATANLSKQKLVAALLTTTSAPSTELSKEKEDGNTPVVDGRDSHQKDATIQPTSKESPDQSDNSAGKLKDALIQGPQNVSTTALTGGKAAAPGANNDSAMTVSVPLLVALIASAVLQ